MDEGAKGGMTNRERAAFSGLLGLIIFATAPFSELVGRIVGIGGLFACLIIANHYLCKPELPDKWPADPDYYD